MQPFCCRVSRTFGVGGEEHDDGEATAPLSVGALHGYLCAYLENEGKTRYGLADWLMVHVNWMVWYMCSHTVASMATETFRGEAAESACTRVDLWRKCSVSTKQNPKFCEGWHATIIASSYLLRLANDEAIFYKLADILTRVGHRYFAYLRSGWRKCQF